MKIMPALGLPGGAEWACLLCGFGIAVGVIALIVYSVRQPTASMPYGSKACPSCGRVNLGDARFCSYCGKAMDHEPGVPN